MDIQIVGFGDIYIVQEKSERGLEWMNSEKIPTGVRAMGPFKHSTDIGIKRRYLVSVAHKMLKAGLEVGLNDHMLGLEEEI